MEFLHLLVLTMKLRRDNVSKKEIPNYVKDYIKVLPPCKKCGCKFHYGETSFSSVLPSIDIRCDACQLETNIAISAIK